MFCIKQQLVKKSEPKVMASSLTLHIMLQTSKQNAKDGNDRHSKELAPVTKELQKNIPELIDLR